VSVAHSTYGADLFDHPGLVLVPLDRQRPISGAAKTLEPPAMRPGGARVAPTDRHMGGLHRYCSGCAHETEHVAWTADGRGSVPSIRWPTAAPADGTTICLNCGQWRAASRQPALRTWSSRPRSRTARQAWPSTLTPRTTGLPRPEPRAKECLRSENRDVRAEAAPGAAASVR
jgi:hypothetical protein